jgi:hypothetical protein
MASMTVALRRSRHDQPQILSAKKSRAEQFFLQVTQFGAAIAATVVQQEA